MATTGRPAKGDRQFIGIRVPAEHKERYEAEASKLGISVSSYLAMALANHHGIRVPETVLDEVEKARRERDARERTEAVYWVWDQETESALAKTA